jgi:hypothetical protein
MRLFFVGRKLARAFCRKALQMEQRIFFKLAGDGKYIFGGGMSFTIFL